MLLAQSSTASTSHTSGGSSINCGADDTGTVSTHMLEVIFNYMLKLASTLGTNPSIY